MDWKRTFIYLLQKVKSQLRMEFYSKIIQQLLLYYTVFLFLLFICARLFVVVHLTYFIVIGVLLITLLYVLSIWRKRPSEYAAALLYDEYIGEERASTAFHYIDKDDPIYVLQRQNAITHMKHAEETVLSRKQRWFYPWKLIAISAMSAAIVINYVFPSEKMDEAKQQQKELKVVKEATKNVQEKLKKAKNPLEKKELQTALDELKESKKADTALKQLIKQREQLELKKIQNEEEQQLLNEYVDQLQTAELEKLANALQESNQEQLLEQLRQIQKNFNQLSDQQKAAISNMMNSSTTATELTDDQIDQIMKQIQEMNKSAKEMTDLAKLQTQLQKEIENLYANMVDQQIPSSLNQVPLVNSNQPSLGKGKGNSNQGQSNHKSGTQGNGQQSSNQGQGNQNNGNSQATGNGQGASNSGNGNGGTSASIGQGANGSGAGLGSGTKQLTIPETIEGKVNVETDQGQLNSDGKPVEQMEGQGPVLKGSVRPYEEVYGQYEDAYRQSSDRMKIPSELETIIKNYFIKIKPDQE